MFSLLNSHEKQIFTGNILLIVCCAFYLAWWLLAFKPSHPITGFKTGWLLIPAGIAGLCAVIQALRGILAKTPSHGLFPGMAVLWGGIILYVILLAITVFLLKRAATTELILIVGWGMLAWAEINALFGFGLFPRGRSIGFIIVMSAAVILALICYVLYYHLGKRAGYIDGVIPLILAALTTAGISIGMLIPSR